MTEAGFMRQALELARQGAGQVEPNPLVGALVVRDGRIVGSGAHRRFGGAHAEVEALQQAGPRAQGAVLFLTLEPCVGYDGKKTPACAELVIRSGIARAVVSCPDPNPMVSGRGLAALRKAKIPVKVGILAGENQRLNTPFFKRHAAGFPYVVLKWAMTLDGKIATRSGDSQWVSSPQARKLGHDLRSKMGAVLVGSGTVLADNPRLKGVVRVILDSWANTPLTSHILKSAKTWRTVFAVSSSCEESRVSRLRRLGAEVHKFEVMDLATILKRLKAEGIARILIEGGGEVHASAVEAGIADEVWILVAPLLVGGRDAKTPVEGRGVEYIAQAARPRNVSVQTLSSGECLIRGQL